MPEKSKETKKTEEKAPEPAATKEASVEKKEEKKKAEKKPKKKRPGVFSHYKVEKEGFKRLLPFCERCGPGYFMANHGNRFTCGHCGFTKYKPAEALT